MIRGIESRVQDVSRAEICRGDVSGAVPYMSIREEEGDGGEEDEDDPLFRLDDDEDDECNVPSLPTPTNQKIRGGAQSVPSQVRESVGREIRKAEHTASTTKPVFAALPPAPAKQNRKALPTGPLSTVSGASSSDGVSPDVSTPTPFLASPTFPRPVFSGVNESAFTSSMTSSKGVTDAKPLHEIRPYKSNTRNDANNSSRADMQPAPFIPSFTTPHSGAFDVFSEKVEVVGGKRRAGSENVSAAAPSSSPLQSVYLPDATSVTSSQSVQPLLVNNKSNNNSSFSSLPSNIQANNSTFGNISPSFGAAGTTTAATSILMSTSFTSTPHTLNVSQGSNAPPKSTNPKNSGDKNATIAAAWGPTVVFPISENSSSVAGVTSSQSRSLLTAPSVANFQDSSLSSKYSLSTDTPSNISVAHESKDTVHNQVAHSVPLPLTPTTQQRIDLHNLKVRSCHDILSRRHRIKRLSTLWMTWKRTAQEKHAAMLRCWLQLFWRKWQRVLRCKLLRRKKLQSDLKFHLNKKDLIDILNSVPFRTRRKKSFKRTVGKDERTDYELREVRHLEGKEKDSTCRQITRDKSQPQFSCVTSFASYLLSVILRQNNMRFSLPCLLGSTLLTKQEERIRNYLLSQGNHSNGYERDINAPDVYMEPKWPRNNALFWKVAVCSDSHTVGWWDDRDGLLQNIIRSLLVPAKDPALYLDSEPTVGELRSGMWSEEVTDIRMNHADKYVLEDYDSNKNQNSRKINIRVEDINIKEYTDKFHNTNKKRNDKPNIVNCNQHHNQIENLAERSTSKSIVLIARLQDVICSPAAHCKLHTMIQKIRSLSREDSSEAQMDKRLLVSIIIVDDSRGSNPATTSSGSTAMEYFNIDHDDQHKQSNSIRAGSAAADSGLRWNILYRDNKWMLSTQELFASCQVNISKVLNLCTNSTMPQPIELVDVHYLGYEQFEQSHSHGYNSNHNGGGCETVQISASIKYEANETVYVGYEPSNSVYSFPFATLSDIRCCCLCLESVMVHLVASQDASSAGAPLIRRCDLGSWISDRISSVLWQEQDQQVASQLVASGISSRENKDGTVTSLDPGGESDTSALLYQLSAWRYTIKAVNNEVKTLTDILRRTVELGSIFPLQDFLIDSKASRSEDERVTQRTGVSAVLYEDLCGGSRMNFLPQNAFDKNKMSFATSLLDLLMLPLDEIKQDTMNASIITSNDSNNIHMKSDIYDQIEFLIDSFISDLHVNNNYIIRPFIKDSIEKGLVTNNSNLWRRALQLISNQIIESIEDQWMSYCNNMNQSLREPDSHLDKYIYLLLENNQAEKNHPDMIDHGMHVSMISSSKHFPASKIMTNAFYAVGLGEDWRRNSYFPVNYDTYEVGKVMEYDTYEDDIVNQVGGFPVVPLTTNERKRSRSSDSPTRMYPIMSSDRRRDSYGKGDVVTASNDFVGEDESRRDVRSDSTMKECKEEDEGDYLLTCVRQESKRELVWMDIIEKYINNNNSSQLPNDLCNIAPNNRDSTKSFFDIETGADRSDIGENNFENDDDDLSVVQFIKKCKNERILFENLLHVEEINVKLSN